MVAFAICRISPPPTSLLVKILVYRISVFIILTYKQMSILYLEN